MTPLDEGTVHRVDLCLTTYSIHKKDNHAPGGIRIRSLTKLAVADLRFRPRGYRDPMFPLLSF